MHVLRLLIKQESKWEVGSYKPNGDWDRAFRLRRLADAVAIVNCLNGGERLDAATITFLDDNMGNG